MPYRDLEALKAREATLAGRLSEIRSQTRELAALAGEAARVQRELDETRTLLVHATPKKKLPLLSSMQVAAPCSESWDAMTGDQRARFCGKCEKNVYDISAMTSDAAEEFLRQQVGEVCVRFHRRADGTVMTADCPVGVRRRRIRRVAVLATAGGMLAAGAAAAMTATTTQGAAHVGGRPGVVPAQAAIELTPAPQTMHTQGRVSIRR